MKLRPEEITSILKQRIAEADVETDLAEVGTVLEIGDGIARVYGLENCVAGEMLDLGADVTGVALNLEEDNVGVALFGEWERVGEGDPVKRTGAVISVSRLPDRRSSESSRIGRMGPTNASASQNRMVPPKKYSIGAPTADGASLRYPISVAKVMPLMNRKLASTP